MAYTDDDLERIYDRTSGKCHLRHKKLSFRNYARYGEKGAWEVEHSKPRARGGGSRLSNLFAACISCNRSKCAGSTRAARSRNGVRCAPLNPQRRKQAKLGNAVTGGGIGALIGGAIAGPAGAWLGGALGTGIGYDKNPDD